MRNGNDLRGYLENCDEGQRELVDPLIDELIFMEKQLEIIHKLPFVRVNAHNSAMSQPTEAFKMYKSIIQQYNNTVKTLAVVFGRAASDGEHPFTAWLKENQTR